MGSPSLKAVSSGLVHRSRVAQARSFSPLSGSAASIGTSSGKARAPAEKRDLEETADIPWGSTGDLGDKDGSSVRSSVDVAEDPCNKSLGLKELVMGYDAPDCGPQ